MCLTGSHYQLLCPPAVTVRVSYCLVDNAGKVERGTSSEAESHYGATGRAVVVMPSAAITAT